MPTNPGYHPDFEIGFYPASLRPAISKIASNFYVTRSFKPIQVGNSEYYGLLIRPTDETSVYINTDREVLVVFSIYDTFQIRTLDAYEEFYDLLESKRIDRSFRFLVSGDERIEAIVKHYLDQHPEYPVVIPITLSNLTYGLGNPLLAAIQRNYLIRDLFGYQNPLREETFFFGRQNEVNSVLDMAKSGQNSSLFGLRKSGKTSVIFAIQRKARAFSCNVAVIDCQNPTVHARTYESLLGYVLSEVRKTFGQKAAVQKLGDNLPEVSENFFQHMKSSLGTAKSNVLLIFDEIENISPRTAASPHWRDGDDPIYFWQILRSFCQTESKGRVSICIVGTSPHILEAAKINGIDNPIYLFAQKRFIPNLTFDETREMVERLGYFMGLEFSPQVIAGLQKDFGGHPFFTRQVCSKVHQLASPTRPVVVSDQALQRAKTEFYGQLESYLRDIAEQLRNSYPEEFDILRAVIDGDKDELNEYGREAPDLIDHLVGYGLVERVGDDFDIKFDAIKVAFRRLLPRDRNSPSDRWAEISARRNKLETDMRLAMYHWCRTVSPEAWTRILDESLTEKRRVALPSSEPSVLFSSKESPLYLSDLFMLLKNPQVLPYLEDRRSLVVKHLDQVNRLRKDAHAIQVDDADLRNVRSAFDYLESEFTPP